MSNNLKALRKQKGWTQDHTAERLGTTRDYYIKLENAKRPLGQKWIDKAAGLFGIEPADILARRTTVPLVGFVRAGAEMFLYEHGQGPFEDVEAPDDSTSETVAVQIEGESLGKSFRGWLIFYDNVQDPPTSELLHELCVLGLEDGRVLVKTLEAGGIEGAYTLHSNVEPPMYDVLVKWAAKVKSMRPRR